MIAATIVKALSGRWHGSYGLARCVCHDDGATPALKISDDARKSDGIDLHCFAGCGWRDIKTELRRRGLLADLTHA
jgi:putative DNA primase/helicase